MLKTYVEKYYREQDYNCAESVFLAANEAWGLHIDKRVIKAVSGFGGGLTCGDVCGAISGGVAAMGFLYVDQRAHQSPLMKEKTHLFMTKVEEKLGTVDCCKLKEIYRTEEEGCLPIIREICDILDMVVATEVYPGKAWIE